jgi:hypothetical protein
MELPLSETGSMLFEFCCTIAMKPAIVRISTLMKLYKPSPRIKAMEMKTCNCKELAVEFFVTKLMFSCDEAEWYSFGKREQNSHK